MPRWWDESETAAGTDWRRRWSLSQPASGPLPSLSPRAKPAQLLSLTLRLFSRTPRPGRTRHSLTHTARTRNGDGREPEQPVHHGLPSRPLVTKKLFFLNSLFRTSVRTPQKQTWYFARGLWSAARLTHLHTESLHVKSQMIHSCTHVFTSRITLSKPQ